MCQDCRIRGLERKKEQFEAPREGRPLHQRPSYPSKSRKVWRDRFESARKSLKQDIEWFIRGREKGWSDSWLYKAVKRNDWVAQKYRKARAEAKRYGAI